MLSQAPSAHCRDAGKTGQLGFRAKRQGGVWGVGTRDWQVGLEQEGLETLSQLPGGLGQFAKNGESGGYFVRQCLNKIKMTYLLLDFSVSLYANKCDAKRSQCSISQTPDHGTPLLWRILRDQGSLRFL